MALLACALLLLAAAVMVGGQLLENRRRERRVAERLQGRMGSDDRLGTLRKTQAALAELLAWIEDQEGPP